MAQTTRTGPKTRSTGKRRRRTTPGARAKAGAKVRTARAGPLYELSWVRGQAGKHKGMAKTIIDATLENANRLLKGGMVQATEIT